MTQDHVHYDGEAVVESVRREGDVLVVDTTFVRGSALVERDGEFFAVERLEGTRFGFTVRVAALAVPPTVGEVARIRTSCLRTTTP